MFTINKKVKNLIVTLFLITYDPRIFVNTPRENLAAL